MEGELRIDRIQDGDYSRVEMQGHMDRLEKKTSDE